MENAGLQLKPAAARSLPLTLVARARQFLPSRVRPADLLIDEEPSKSGWTRALLTYLAIVILPSCIYLAYKAAVESPGYVSETRLTVKSAPKKQASLLEGSSSILSKLVGGAASDTERDAYIVLNYIKSASMLNDLGGRPTLERFFSKPDIDWLSRLPRGEPMEELLQYWRAHVSANVDTVSGLLTVKITAYTPQDALELTKSINTVSEKLINNISLRVREDALAKAKVEVTRAGDDLATRRAALLAFRNANELIDPVARAKSIGETIASLTLEKVDAETTVSVLTRSNITDSPSLNVIKSKLATLNQQIEGLKAQLTASAGDGTVSSQLAGFEALKLQEEFATKIYVIDQEAYLRAQQELQRQQLYLITVVQPTLAEEATYPKVLQSTMLIAICLSIVWAIVALIVASVRDQID